MKIIKDERQWYVNIVLKREDCIYLYYPNISYGCRYDDPNYYKNKECNYDICPFRILEKV